MLFLKESGVQPAWDMARLRARAEHLHEMGFGVADAAHVAFAEASAQVLITCDDRLLRRCMKTETALAVMGPTEFCVKEGLR